VKPLGADVHPPARRVGDRLAADDDGGGIAQQLASEPPAEARRRGPREDRWQLPWREVEQGHDQRQPRCDRQRPRADRVVDGAARAAAAYPPGRPDRRAAQDERVDRVCGRAEPAGRRDQPPADDLQAIQRNRRIVEV
jgi:hypothetical protein